MDAITRPFPVIRRGGVRFCGISRFEMHGRMDSGWYPERFNLDLFAFLDFGDSSANA